MIRSSRLGQMALGLVVLVAGSASLPAADLYGFVGVMGGTNRFGKINTDTLVYTELNSNPTPGYTNEVSGLAWNPGIGAFNSLTSGGVLSTITTNGTTGTQIASGLPLGANLAYNSVNSLMYLATYASLKTLNTTTGVTSNIGSAGANSLYSMTFVDNTLYGTVSQSGGSGYGNFNINTGAFTKTTATNNTYDGMKLAYDGTTLFGLNYSTLYTLNPSTGAYTLLGSVTGIPGAGAGRFTNLAAIPVPEPSTYALAAIATGVMAAIARRRKARKG